MMTSLECALAWKEIVRIYNETKEETPAVTMQKIVDSIGLEDAKEVFATVATIKKYDGRIYGKNREYMNSIPVNPKSVKWEHENDMVYAGLDNIHTAHINNLITELLLMENKKETKMESKIVSKELLNTDRELLGQAVFMEVVSDSKSCEEIGCDIMDILYDCKTQQEYDLVNSAVRAITGCSLDELTDIAKELEDKEYENPDTDFSK